MTQEEIIEMYMQVSKELCNDTEWCWAGVGEPLQMFAKLVAAKEREAAIKIIKKTPFSNWFQADLVEAIRVRGNA